jgi:hypothetical protein
MKPVMSRYPQRPYLRLVVLKLTVVCHSQKNPGPISLKSAINSTYEHSRRWQTIVPASCYTEIPSQSSIGMVIFIRSDLGSKAFFKRTLGIYRGSNSVSAM